MKTLLFTISLAVGSLHALAAAEPVYCNGVPATIVATGPGTITGTTGNDVIVGSPGNDQIFGLEGNDLICGGGGSDTITGGRGDDEIYTLSGNDTIIWNPGDGNDRINTATGFDTLQMNLSNADEIIALSAVNGRLRLVRNIASITLDAGGIEKVNLPVVGGADHITVNNLSGTGVSEVVIDLAVVSGVGDGAADTIVVNGTVGADVLAITGSATLLQVSGGSPLVTIKQCEALNDTLIVNGLEGPDQLNALSIPAGVIKMKLDGGPGNDLINGSGGADELIAGPGDDTVRGGQGSDIVTLGAGNDTFLWLPGDSSDHIEGEAGTDIIQMTGSNAAENVELTASAGRLHLARDVGNVTVDAAGIERVHFAASGGADRITVDNLTGIGVSEITLDLAGGAGFGDVSVDTVIVRGTPDNDVIGISAPQGVITLNGPSTLLRILNPEPAYDVLLVEGKAGVDEIDAHSLPAGLIGLQITGGQGNDVLVGSQGNDTFIWNPGDGSDEIDGKAGLDTLQMYGSNAPENIELSAQGKRLILTRDVATVRHEVKATEVVNVNVSGGADRITIGDLTGTGVNRVAIQLANAAGLGDGQSDSIVVNGTNGNDAVIISGSAANLTIAGLAATIELSTLEAAFDSVRVNGLNGNDLLHAQNVPAGVVRLQLDGGAGNDILIGSAGNDELIGGPGNDQLTGGLGADIFNGGDGTDIYTDFNAAQGDVATIVVPFSRPQSQEAVSEESSAPAAKRTPREAIERAISLLESSDAEFSRQNGCVSCHNQLITTRARAAARNAGIGDDSTTLARWARSFEATDDVEAVASMLVALGAAGAPADAETDAAVNFLAGKQEPNGSWAAIDVRAASLDSSPITRTALAVKAMRLYSWPARQREFDERVAKAREWLFQAKPRTAQELSHLLLGLSWTGGDVTGLSRFTADLLPGQRPDGGWSRSPQLEPDAYSTAVALYALIESRSLTPVDERYRAGVGFLLRTQLGDGSWHAAGRAPAPQSVGHSGFPHDRHQWISAIATGYAVMALAPAVKGEVAVDAR